jgi:hypothetical protein
MWPKSASTRHHPTEFQTTSETCGAAACCVACPRPIRAAGRGPRWRYIWKDKVPPELANAMDYVPKALIDRPNLLISEEGDRIQIDLKEIVIIIQQRKKNAK